MENFLCARHMFISPILTNTSLKTTLQSWSLMIASIFQMRKLRDRKIPTTISEQNWGLIKQSRSRAAFLH